MVHTSSYPYLPQCVCLLLPSVFALSKLVRATLPDPVSASGWKAETAESFNFHLTAASPDIFFDEHANLLRQATDGDGAGSGRGLTDSKGKGKGTFVTEQHSVAWKIDRGRGAYHSLFFIAVCVLLSVMRRMTTLLELMRPWNLDMLQNVDLCRQAH
jgi:hypothetical protein